MRCEVAVRRGERLSTDSSPVDSFGKPRLQTWVYRPMRILLSRAAHADKNFSVALGLLLILSAADILSASLYYICRIFAAGKPSHAANSALTLPATTCIE